MKIKELRIGNLVQDESGSTQYVYRLWDAGAELSENIDGEDDLDYMEDEIFGVSITEEILLINLGFKKTEFNKSNYIIHIGNFCIRKIEDDERGKWLIELNPDLINGISRVALIDFVHELQNIYYDIKKEDLIYSPTA